MKMRDILVCFQPSKKCIDVWNYAVICLVSEKSQNSVAFLHPCLMKFQVLLLYFDMKF